MLETRSTVLPNRLKEREGPWRWLSEGAEVYSRQPLLSAGYGLLFTSLGYAVAFALTRAGMAAAFPVAVGLFALIGPLMAAGLYAIAKADEEGRRASAREVLFPKAASPTQIGFLGVVILVSVFLWILAAIGIFAVFLPTTAASLTGFAAYSFGTAQGIGMLILGTVVGGFIAAVIFAMTAFSIPMLMDRKTDGFTAIGRSVQHVLGRPREMLLWAWLIALSVAIGAATLLVGFVYLFPLLGYATWRGYRRSFASGD